MCLYGCSPPSNREFPTEGTTKGDKKGDNKPQSANTRSGEATRFTMTMPKTKLWTITWQFAEVAYDEKGRFGGEMNEVRGSVYDQGEAKSAFRAKLARAEYGSNKLTMSGTVIVEVAEPKTMLRCREIVWNPEANRYEAKGDVTVETEQYQLGPFDAVYASSDLKTVGSPNHFSK